MSKVWLCDRAECGREIAEHAGIRVQEHNPYAGALGTGGVLDFWEFCGYGCLHQWALEKFGEEVRNRQARKEAG